MLIVGSIVIRVDELAAQTAFWTQALDYEVREPRDADFAVLRPRKGAGPNVSLDAVPAPRALPPKIHLDLYAENQDAEVARLTVLGARVVPWEKMPDDADFVIMEDPEGVRFCVIDAADWSGWAAHEQLAVPGRMKDTDHVTAAAFHRAPGVADWRVTPAGPQAVFIATSFAQASGLVAPVVAAADEFGVMPDVDLRPGAVIVRVESGGPHEIPAAASAFAAAVSRAAADLGLTADPSRVQMVGIYVAQHSGADARPFFNAALGYEDLGETDAIDPLRRGPDLAFNPITGDTPGRGRTHFDVFVPSDHARARVDAALAAGGRLVDDSYAPAWWSLASPENHGVDIASWPDTYE